MDCTVSMLASPLRRCIATDLALPSAMMICLRIVRMPKQGETGSFQNMLVPVRLNDDPVPSGKSIWVACWHEAMTEMIERERYKRMKTSVVPTPNMSPRIHSALAYNVAQRASSPALVARQLASGQEADDDALVIDLDDCRLPLTSDDRPNVFRMRPFLEMAPVGRSRDDGPLEALLRQVGTSSGTSNRFAFAATDDEEGKRALVELTKALHRARWWTGQGWT